MERNPARTKAAVPTIDTSCGFCCRKNWNRADGLSFLNISSFGRLEVNFGAPHGTVLEPASPRYSSIFRLVSGETRSGSGSIARFQEVPPAGPLGTVCEPFSHADRVGVTRFCCIGTIFLI